MTFSSARPRQPLGLNLYWRPTDGSGEVELLLDKEYPQYPGSWSPGGRALVFWEEHPDTGLDLWVLEDGIPKELVVTDASERHPMFSPNGQWIAYDSDRSGRREIYVRPYPGPGRDQLVSTEGGSHPFWSRDGDELFYQTAGGQVMVVSVETPSVELGAPQRLFEIPNLWEGGGRRSPGW